MKNEEQLQKEIKEEFQDKLFLAFDFANYYLLNEYEIFEILKETFENCYSQKTLNIKEYHKEKNNIIYRSII